MFVCVIMCVLVCMCVCVIECLCYFVCVCVCVLGGRLEKSLIPSQRMLTLPVVAMDMRFTASDWERKTELTGRDKP